MYEVFTLIDRDYILFKMHQSLWIRRRSLPQTTTQCRKKLYDIQPARNHTPPAGYTQWP
jgi:hypothetical protein